MDSTRRTFLKIAGACAAGLAVKPATDALAMDLVLPTPKSAAPDAAALRAGKWAMVVDVKKFTEESRQAVAAACRAAHNIPEIPNEKHEIKWIWEEHFENAFPGQGGEHLPPEVSRTPLMVLCNHCESPACVRVCPTKATFQRADGIVMMDYHRCIGCRFCMAGCPYGSRSFNFEDPRKYLENPDPNYPTRTKGVVEKCNFCAERLAIGQLPACVEACQNGELLFGDLEDPSSVVSQALRANFTIRRKPELGTQPKVYYII
ncbi:MAG: sulfate reduction electron transfer complex DsrMKJOP subunit DsrO [Thermodesulfobacteriota bacterium]